MIKKMDCKQAIILFIQDIEKQIDNVKSEKLSKHLSQCKLCQKQYSFIKELFLSVAQVQNFNPEVSWLFTERTITKIKNYTNSEISISSWIYNILFRKTSVLSASATALIVGVILGIFISSIYYKSKDSLATTEIQTVEEVYLVSTSNEYIIEFFNKQKYN